jgi:hypothetical protein
MSRNGIGALIAVPLAIGAAFFALPSISLLLVTLVFTGSALLSLRCGRIDRVALAVVGGALILFFGLFFAPVWYAAAVAKTPGDHLRVSEAYASRGQLFGNPTEALRHLTIAAEGGNPEAAARLGEAYMFGHYRVAKDTQLAKRWLTTASTAGVKRSAMLIEGLQPPP